MALGYIGKTSARGIDWVALLAYVDDSKEVTAKEVAAGLGLGHLSTTMHRGKERQYHSGPAEAGTRLNRLNDWGMVYKSKPSGGLITYKITDYGKEVLAHPEKMEEKALGEEPKQKRTAKVEDLYPDLGAYGGVVKGPVALMRLVEVTDVSQVTRRIPAKEFAVERKFDGWLCQVAGGRIYSRRGMELTEKFIPIYKTVGGFTDDHLIGELVYWTPEGKMDETSVTRVAGTADPEEAYAKLKAMPGTFQLIAFDVIARGDEDISDRPFYRRREILEKMIRPGKHLALSAVYPFDKWRKAYEEALAEGGEGVVFKNMQAPYLWRKLGEREAQPVGVQYKLKAIRTDDFVVFNASRGEKGRLLLHFGQFWKGRLIPIGEVDNLSEENEKEAIKRLNEGPFVVEIAFQERYPKPPGHLRSPRVVRFRDEKPIDSATLPREYAPR
jgi:ATP-dependent DNA ligase